MTLAVVERFGPTIQGEGPQTGRLCSFIRFGACNLSCSWCDSAYTWDAKRFPPREHITMMSWAEALDGIPEAPMLVLTGGEPLMQQKREGWAEFLTAARERFEFIAVETNGTLAPTGITATLVDQFVVSPKLASVQMLRAKQDRTPWDLWGDFAAEFPGQVDLKVVVSEPRDVAEALRIAESAGIARRHLWLMPEGITTEALAERWRWVAEAATASGCNASHRLHTLAWGEERGR
jgi:organic radical activating enzyme